MPTLGWKGRHHRVLGDIHWPHANSDEAVTAFENARTEAKQHNAAGERTTTQVRIALATAVTDPMRATEELALADQLLAGLDQRANRILAQVVALIKDAGSYPALTDRAQALRAAAENAGLPYLTRYVELGLALSTMPSAALRTTSPPPSAASSTSPRAATSASSPTSPTSWPACPCPPFPSLAKSSTGGGVRSAWCGLLTAPVNVRWRTAQIR
ncbi:hypothetical protein ACFXPM_30975 [Streptomyces sp. NPDC059095]|uniref:hypothetical protein n=1 Tax=Streptomyces sp. NPDC059095 TaxID=3346726 RepID=UPI0036BAEF32